MTPTTPPPPGRRVVAREAAGPADDEDLAAVTEAVLFASRALVGVAARSLDAAANRVTLPQFRALVLLAAGPRTSVSLANALAVHASTATRLADRLVRKGLISRTPGPDSLREVEIGLTPEGRAIVGAVLSRRRQDIATIVERIPRGQRRAVVQALQAFGAAAGEAPEQSWSLGWAAPPAPGQGAT